MRDELEKELQDDEDDEANHSGGDGICIKSTSGKTHSLSRA